MARVYTVIRDAIRAAANTAGGIHELMLGTPGSDVSYPDPDEYPGVGVKTYDRGTVWDTNLIPAILEQLGAHFDGFFISWALIDTKATTVTPTYTESFGFDTGTAISKNESLNQITLTFDASYDSVNYIGLGLCEDASPSASAWMSMVTKNAGSVVVEFYRYDTGARQTINNRLPMVVIVGKK